MPPTTQRPLISVSRSPSPSPTTEPNVPSDPTTHPYTSQTSNNTTTPSRPTPYFLPGTDIAREVIIADIQRYLGPDALVRPGEHEGTQGYFITAYRNLTAQMVQDLKMDSMRWEGERGGGCDRAGRASTYADSRTHAARQHWGPTVPEVESSSMAAELYRGEGGGCAAPAYYSARE